VSEEGGHARHALAPRHGFVGLALVVHTPAQQLVGFGSGAGVALACRHHAGVCREP